MFPDEGYAPAVPSFPSPILPPISDPGASPTKTVAINCSWLPYIRGALLQLVLQSTWRTSDPDALTLAQMRAMTLISLFDECSELVLPFSCDFDIESSADGLPFQLRPESCFDTSPLSAFTVGAGFTSVEAHDHCDNQQWTRAECEIFFTERHITFIVMGFDKLSGTYYTSPGDDINIIGWHGGGVVFVESRNSQVLGDGSGLSLGWVGDALLDQITLRVSCGVMSGSTSPGGGSIIRTARIDGYATVSLCGSE